MPFNINAFRDNLAKYGYMDSNNFEVMIATPQVLLNSSLNSSGSQTDVNRIASNLKLRIDQVRAPGISIQSSEVYRYGIGPVQKMPATAQNQEIHFSILVDEFGEIWQYWYNWIRSIFEFNGTESSNSGEVNSMASYTAEYKDKYSTVMQIIIYDHWGNVVQRINLFEAFPTAIREVPFNWGDANLLKLNVTVAFTEFIIVGSNVVHHNQAPTTRRTGFQVDR